MNLRQIRYFVAAARHGSLVAASRALHVSQPALGQQIALLEQELGVTLLLRHPRGVRLLPAGTVFLDHAEAVLERLQQAERAVQVFRGRPGRHLVVGVTPTAGRALVPDWLAACGAHAWLRLSIRHGLTDDLLKQLSSGELDVALCYDPPPEVAGSIPLYTEDFFLVGPPGTAGPVAFADLPAYPLILDSSIRRLVEGVAGPRHLRLDIRGEVEPVGPKREMLLRNRYWSIISKGLFQDDIDDGRMTARPIVDPRLSKTLHVCWRKAGRDDAVDLVVGLLPPLVRTTIETGILGWRLPA